MRSTPDYLLVEEAADIARTTVSTIRHWINTRRLAARKPGRRVLIRRVDLLRFLDSAGR